VDKPVVILGAGGHAKVLIEALRLSGVHLLGVVDSHRPVGTVCYDGLRVLGNDRFVLDYSVDEVDLINGLGSLPGQHQRKRLYEDFVKHGFRFASVVHPTAVVSRDVTLAQGVQVLARSVISPAANIGENTIVNTGAIIEHDCVIGSHNHLAPGVVLSGEVTTGEAVHVGTGAMIVQGLSIGANCVVGAGVVVTRDLPQRATIYPAKPFIKTFEAGDEL
jgi:UDP-perosamine 4-acetyltransferase